MSEVRTVLFGVPCILPLLLLAACSTNHPGVYAGSAAGSIVGSAVRVNGRHTSEAVYWGTLGGAGIGYLGESLIELFSGGSRPQYVLRVPIIRRPIPPEQLLIEDSFAKQR